MISSDLPKSYIRMLMNRVGGTILLYLLISIIIGLLVGIFSIVLQYVMLTMDATSDIQDYSALLENIEENSLFNSLLLLFSPLLALLVAFIGSSLTHIKLKSLLKPSPLKASTFTVIALITLGISCLASYLIYPIDAIFSLFNLTAKLPDFLGMPVEQPLYMAFYVIAICVGAPLAEELLFRGVILHALKPYGNSFAILISALFFGLIHGNFVQGPGAFLIGVALGVVTLRTGSLLPAIFIHAINNTLSVLQGYLAQVTSLSDTLIYVVDALIIITAIVLVLKNWPRIKNFSHVMHVPPDSAGTNIITTATTEIPLQTDISYGPRIQEAALSQEVHLPHEPHLMQEAYLDNRANFTNETSLKNEDSPFFHRRWYSFWTSWTMLIALISCVALLFFSGIQPL